MIMTELYLYIHTCIVIELDKAVYLLFLLLYDVETQRRKFPVIAKKTWFCWLGAAVSAVTDGATHSTS